MTYSNGSVLGISTSVVSTLALTGANSNAYFVIGVFVAFLGVFGLFALISKNKEGLI